MIEFKVIPHSIFPSVRVVEILIDGDVIGVIYPEKGGNGIKIVSVHMADTAAEEDFAGKVIQDDGSKTWPPIPAVHIQFNPSPYTIRGGRIVKLP